MNKFISMVFVAVFWAGVLQAEMLLHWDFNDADTTTTVAADSSGRGIIGAFQSAGVAAAQLQTGAGVSGRPGDYAYNGTTATGMGELSTGAGAGRIKYSGPGFESGYQSLTLCGWFKTESAPISHNARLFTAVGTKTLNLFEASGAGLRFQIGSSIVDSGAGTYTNSGTWTFFAVTYDGTVPAGNDNVKFWVGDTKGLSLVKSAELSGAGAWDGMGESSEISMGNRHGGVHGKYMNRPFDGYMDDFRIYGERSGSGGALSEEQLNAIRAGARPAPAQSQLIVG